LLRYVLKILKNCPITNVLSVSGKTGASVLYIFIRNDVKYHLFKSGIFPDFR